MEQSVQEITSQTLAFFLQESNLQDVSFPFIANTYTLWRKMAFRQLQKQFLYLDMSAEKSHDLILQFYLESECLYLRSFLEKVKLANSLSMDCLKEFSLEYVRHQKQSSLFPISEAEAITLSPHYEDLIELNSLLWLVTLYGELFIDIVSIQYLAVIFPPTNRYRIRQDFQSQCITNLFMTDQADGFVNQNAKNVFEKLLKSGLSKFTQKIISKTFIMQINTVVGSFNPMLLASSFGLSFFMKSYKKNKEEEKRVDKLENTLKICKFRFALLEETYEKCLSEIKQYLSASEAGVKEKSKHKIQKLVLSILEKDWLKVEVSHQDEWEVVRLTQQQQFENISSIE